MKRWLFRPVCATPLPVLASPAMVQQRGLMLHVLAPDWRDPVIHFVLTDRFDNGNPGYGPGWGADAPALDDRPNAASRPTARPLQSPFDLNDPRRAADRWAGIHHWTPDIPDVTVRDEELKFQTSGLDDLNTENPRVRRHPRLRAHGWSDALFDPEGADAPADGRSITPAAEISTDAAGRRARFTIPSEALGDPASPSDARDFVSTWDCAGTWRPLACEASSFTVGGGDPDAPKVWSASPVITLP